MDDYKKIIKLASEVKEEIMDLDKKDSHTEFFKLIDNILTKKNHGLTKEQLSQIHKELTEISSLGKKQVKKEKKFILESQKNNEYHTKYITNQGIKDE